MSNTGTVSLSAPNLEVLLSKFPFLLNESERQYPDEKRTQILRLRVSALLKNQSGQQQRAQVHQVSQPPQNVPDTPRQSPRVVMQQQVQAPQQQMDPQVRAVLAASLTEVSGPSTNAATATTAAATASRVAAGEIAEATTTGGSTTTASAAAADGARYVSFTERTNNTGVNTT